MSWHVFTGKGPLLGGNMFANHGEDGDRRTLHIGTPEDAISLAVALIQATEGMVAAESNGTTLKVPFAFALAAGLSVVQRERALDAGLALIRAASKESAK